MGTGFGVAQTFYVPQGATRFYLSIIDDGGYFDNRGIIEVDIDSSMTAAVPESSTWPVMLLGFAGIGTMAYRLRKSAHLVA